MGRPGWDHRGLPCDPGRCLCQDIALLAQLPVLTPQTGQLLALGAGRALLSAAFIAIGLSHPVPDRLGGRFELARQLLRCSPRSDQINHLSPEFRRIGPVTLLHRSHLLLNCKGVHQTGSTPNITYDPLRIFKIVGVFEAVMRADATYGPSLFRVRNARVEEALGAKVFKTGDFPASASKP